MKLKYQGEFTEIMFEAEIFPGIICPPDIPKSEQCQIKINGELVTVFPGTGYQYFLYQGAWYRVPYEKMGDWSVLEFEVVK